ncbi:hypothetical protein D3C76_1782660 [compost metagenome]
MDLRIVHPHDQQRRHHMDMRDLEALDQREYLGCATTAMQHYLGAAEHEALQARTGQRQVVGDR